MYIITFVNSICIRIIFLVIAWASICLSVSANAGEYVVYDGTNTELLQKLLVQGVYLTENEYVGPSGLDVMGGAPSNFENLIIINYNNDSINEIAGGVYGAFKQAGAVVYNNTVEIRNGYAPFVVGGYTNFGLNSGNIVNVYSGNVGSVMGGQSGVGDITSTNIVIYGGTVGTAYAGKSHRGDVFGNTAFITGGEIEAVFGGYNTGLWTYQQTVPTGFIFDNSVVVSGGTVSSVFGGYSEQEAPVYENSVVITGGSIDRVIGGYSGAGDTHNNTVTISGGYVDQLVYGSSSWSGQAINNVVNISGDSTFSQSAIILGGTSQLNENVFSGNILNVCHGSLRVNEINNFENYNFCLTSSLNNESVVIEITGENPVNLEDTNIALISVEKGAKFKQGDRIVLISYVNGMPATMSGLSNGANSIYDIDLLIEDSALFAIINEVYASLYPEPFSEGRAAGLVFLNRGSELTQGQGIGALLASTQQQGLSAYGAFSGGEERVETGSYVDVNGFSLLTGLGWGANLGGGRLTLGAFFEAGMGGYDSHNSFTTGAVEGDGSTTYYGGGLTGRYDYLCGGYAEASMRAGFSRTDFESGDIVLNGNSADFETSAGYYGGHFGLGYKWDITNSGELDLYTKWLWTHLEDDDVTVLGDPVKFKDSDSHRWRTGARFEYSLADNIKPYVGAAYEYEFDGEIEATADGSDIDKPSLKGGTGVGEVGVRLGNLLEKGDLSIDLGLQGSVGQREGMGGSFQLKWLF